MRYVGILKKGVIISKGINYTDYEDVNEIEITKEQYDTITIPCRLVDDEFVVCEFPESDVVDVKYEKPVTEIEQLRADVDYIAAMTGVEL